MVSTAAPLAEQRDTAKKVLRANKLLFDRLSAGGCTCEPRPVERYKLQHFFAPLRATNTPKLCHTYTLTTLRESERAKPNSKQNRGKTPPRENRTVAIKV